MRWTIVLGCGLLAAGCSGSHAAPGDPVAGEYDLSVVTVRDDCSPARSEGSFRRVAVHRIGDTLNVPVGANPGRQELSTPSYAREAVVTFEGCPDLSLEVAWSPLWLGRESFSLELRQRWRGVVGCDEEDYVFGRAPVADCESVQELQFELLEACEPVCGWPSCACP